MAKMLDVLPDRIAVYPTELANRLAFAFTGRLLPLLFVPKKDWHVRIKPNPSGNGILYVNEKNELLLGRPA